MIQFLNIAGTGPIFGAIMGAKFGPSAYLWIVLGCIFAGATHDYLSGMLSMRNGGADLPSLVQKYLGGAASKILLVFAVFLLVMVGTVFVYSPAEILGHIGGSKLMWVAIIFIYYIIATMLPIDKIIGKVYPVFSFSLLFMAVALIAVLLIKMPTLPELWDGLGNMGKQTDAASFTEDIFPCLFITIACGAISGFHEIRAQGSPHILWRNDNRGFGCFGMGYGVYVVLLRCSTAWLRADCWRNGYRISYICTYGG